MVRDSTITGTMQTSRRLHMCHGWRAALPGKRSFLLPTRNGLQCCLIACLVFVGVPSLATAQTPYEAVVAPSANLPAMLEQQQLEITALRAQLAEHEQRFRSLPSVAEEVPAEVQPEWYYTQAEAAKEKKGEDQSLQKRVEDLEKKLKKQEDAAKKKYEVGTTDVSTEKWTVKLGGHVQFDYINWAQAAPTIPNTQDYFEFRRLRLFADGSGYGVYDFRLQMTLEPETVGESSGAATSPDVKDAYFSVNEIPWIGRFRIGNFFVPFSLEQVTNDTNNIFMERSIPSQGIFAADRDMGVACYNANESQTFTWTYGAFFDSTNDTLKERIDDNQGYRLAGRVTWLPYYDEGSNGRYLIHTGAGVLYTDDQDNSVRLRARPQIHEGPRLIDSGAIVADDYLTGNLEMAIVCGRVTFQSEAFLSQVNRLAAPNVNINGAYLHASYFLTGENRIYEKMGPHGAQFGRNTPYNNVFVVPGGVSLGAWEAKARWSHLDLNALDRGQYNDLTLGFNWYWSDRVRMLFDWIHPFTSSETPFGQTESDILATRFDFNW
jgi:phosphate-selective porin OprO and OprP